MALTEKQIQEVTTAGQAFLEKRRPPEEKRKQLDLAYRIEGRSVLVYEIRENWLKPDEFIESPVAKTTFVQTQHHWKVFWMRADLKWHGYSPRPSVTSIKSFFKLVDEDKHACFFG